MSDVTYKRCRECSGRGSIMGGGMIASRDCDECKGSGRIALNNYNGDDSDDECIELEQPRKKARERKFREDY
jgi:DnaJ-class molecular chaperone